MVGKVIAGLRALLESVKQNQSEDRLAEVEEAIMEVEKAIQ